MNIIMAYESFDGKLFHTKEQCLKHEAEKKKYPLTKFIETDIKGDLGVKKKIDSSNTIPNHQKWWLGIFVCILLSTPQISAFFLYRPNELTFLTLYFLYVKNVNLLAGLE